VEVIGQFAKLNTKGQPCGKVGAEKQRGGGGDVGRDKGIKTMPNGTPGTACPQ